MKEQSFVGIGTFEKRIGTNKSEKEIRRDSSSKAMAKDKESSKFIGFAPEKREFKAREKTVGNFVSNLSKGGGKAKANRSLGGLSLTGNRRY